MKDERLQRWEAAADLPLTVAAVGFLVAYAAPILWPDLPGAVIDACWWIQTGVWVAFAVDYFARLTLASDRRLFVRSNLLDLAVIAAPLLRPLRLLRLLMLLQVVTRTAGNNLRGRVAVFVGGGTALVLLLASLSVLEAERPDSDANINGFGDALWWSATTMATVGYGDRFPVTDRGRLIAVALMLCGIALLGVVTASLASWLVERVREIEEESQTATRRDVNLLAAQVEALRAELAERQATEAAARGAPREAGE